MYAGYKGRVIVLDQRPCGYGFVQNSCFILVPVQ